MYGNFDEEVFLAPESIVSGVLAASAFDEDLELPDVGPLAHWVAAATSREDAEGDTEADASGDPPWSVRRHGGWSTSEGDAWSRQAAAANGFGG